jgi:hypothetical protein
VHAELPPSVVPDASVPPPASFEDPPLPASVELPPSGEEPPVPAVPAVEPPAPPTPAVPPVEEPPAPADPAAPALPDAPPVEDPALPPVEDPALPPVEDPPLPPVDEPAEPPEPPAEEPPVPAEEPPAPPVEEPPAPAVEAPPRPEPPVVVPLSVESPQDTSATHPSPIAPTRTRASSSVRRIFPFLSIITPPQYALKNRGPFFGTRPLVLCTRCAAHSVAETPTSSCATLNGLGTRVRKASTRPRCACHFARVALQGKSSADRASRKTRFSRCDGWTPWLARNVPGEPMPRCTSRGGRARMKNQRLSSRSPSVTRDGWRRVICEQVIENRPAPGAAGSQLRGGRARVT